MDSFRYFLKLQKSFITAVGIDWDFLVLPRELKYAIFMAFIVLLFLDIFFCCPNSTSTCPTFLQLTIIFICPYHLHLLRSHDFRLIQSIWSIFIQSALQITTATHNPSYLYAFLQYLFVLNRASSVFVFFSVDDCLRKKGILQLLCLHFKSVPPSLRFFGVTFLFPP